LATVSDSALTAESSPSAATDVAWKALAPGVEINEAAWTPAAERILTPSALDLVARLHRELQEERRRLLDSRLERQAAFDRGALPGYLDGEVADRARGDWRIAPLPEDLLARRVEITGPVNDPKMVINMLSRTPGGDRADAAMLDFEDSMKPSWTNVVRGVENLIGAADGTLTFVRPARGERPEKLYELNPEDMPLLMVRCRGLHLDESNLRVDGEAVSGGLMELALAAHHTAERLLARGRTPKYYVPKVEHYLEARWWDRLLGLIEEALGLPRSTVRATFLIETLPAAFQMEEILYELRDHAAGLNVGRWDKIFSDIKVLGKHPDRILEDRGSISLNRPWMKNYALRLIRICHRHGAFAMGGMAAFTPGRTPEMREQQTRKVVEDKEFEFSLGHDGCWVSHPYFIGPALSAFPREKQLDVIPEIEDRPELLPVSTPPRTLDGLRKNVRVGIAYLKGWNQDIGCVAWDDLMEDLATLEISRAQTWQWLRHGVDLDDGTTVTQALVERIVEEELARIADEVREAMAAYEDDVVGAEIERFATAKADACRIFTEAEFRPFLSMGSELAR
jgi:malate synthase